MNPCCGTSLRKGTQIVAIIQIIWHATIFIASTAAFILGILYFHNSISNRDEALLVIIGLALMIPGFLCASVSIGSFVATAILLKAIKEWNVRKCRNWMIFHSVICIILMIALICGLFAIFFFLQDDSLTVPLLSLIPIVFHLLLQTYFISVIFAFTQELTVIQPEHQYIVFSQSNKA